MPSASNTPLPSSFPPAHLRRPKSPTQVLAEAEAQWLFTEAELANTPSIQDGMSQAEERETRSKGVNFIIQVGIMLKLPQLTLSTAAIFFQRFLMRASLRKERNGIPKLHHYQAAATALFLATKVEESCRKMRELILAFCRVAQKNPNLVIDEQSKDWWRWRDCILLNEDILLETLCFDLTVESPHRKLFDLLKIYGVEHNKRLRNQAWAFVTDSNNTQLCLLCTSRTIAVSALYAACRFCNVALPDNSAGRPWWEVQHVSLKEMRRALSHMCAAYEPSVGSANGQAVASGSEGDRSIYKGLSTPLDGGNDEWDTTRLREDKPASVSGNMTERRMSDASSVGTKRDRDDDDSNALMDGRDHTPSNGVDPTENGAKRPRLYPNSTEAESHMTRGGAGVSSLGADDSHDTLHREEASRVRNGNEHNRVDVRGPTSQSDRVPTVESTQHIDEAEGSEEGEVEE